MMPKTFISRAHACTSGSDSQDSDLIALLKDLIHAIRDCKDLPTLCTAATILLASDRVPQIAQTKLKVELGKALPATMPEMAHDHLQQAMEEIIETEHVLAGTKDVDALRVLEGMMMMKKQVKEMLRDEAESEIFDPRDLISRARAGASDKELDALVEGLEAAAQKPKEAAAFRVASAILAKDGRVPLQTRVDARINLGEATKHTTPSTARAHLGEARKEIKVLERKLKCANRKKRKTLEKRA
jgi:hypothetical protein